MIEKLFNNPHVLTQKPGDEHGIAEPFIAASTDASGLIILNQNGHEILVNLASVNDLCKLLRLLKNLVEKQK